MRVIKIAGPTLLCLLIACGSFAQQLAKRLTNQDVIDMVSLGLSDEVIIEKLRASNGSDFDTTVPGLKALKAGHVSDAVIRIMINPSLALAPARGAVNAASVAEPSLLPESGVYVVRNDRPAEVPPEIVTWKTGGVVKGIVTMGIVKGDRNGKVNRPQSRTQLAAPLEFLIKTPEDTSVEEYQLLHLHRKDNRREFRSVTGGVFHESGGAIRDDVPFQSDKIGIRTWRISLSDLPNGEYGFLPPGVASASISSSGKMYTFGVVDGQGSRQSSQSSKNVSGSLDAANSSYSAAAPASMGASSSGNPTVRHDGVI
ncbi:MAG TPA: hypothetical protein VH088_18660, partial [Terriglobales bacterium]|nr:hypothetical protein [Terriglobales bacterium]